MAGSTLGPIPSLPPPQQPLTDKNGVVTKDWYMYLQRVDAHIREIEKRLTAGGL